MIELCMNFFLFGFSGFEVMVDFMFGENDVLGNFKLCLVWNDVWDFFECNFLFWILVIFIVVFLVMVVVLVIFILKDFIDCNLLVVWYIFLVVYWFGIDI